LDSISLQHKHCNGALTSEHLNVVFADHLTTFINLIFLKRLSHKWLEDACWYAPSKMTLRCLAACPNQELSEESTRLTIRFI
jgi:hypothetical protein